LIGRQPIKPRHRGAGDSVANVVKDLSVFAPPTKRPGAERRAPSAAAVSAVTRLARLLVEALSTIYGGDVSSERIPLIIRHVLQRKENTGTRAEKRHAAKPLEQ